MRGSTMQTCSSLNGAMRSSGRSAGRRRSSTSDSVSAAGGPLQERLQPVDAAQLHQQHGEPPVGRLRDRRLAVEEAQQVLARGVTGVRGAASGGGGRTGGRVHDR